MFVLWPAYVDNKTTIRPGNQERKQKVKLDNAEITEEDDNDDDENGALMTFRDDWSEAVASSAKQLTKAVRFRNLLRLITFH